MSPATQRAEDAVHLPMPDAMPPESPLAMPAQDLSEAPPRRTPARRARSPWAARAFVFALAAVLTAYGAREMYEVVSVSGTTVLQWVLLGLFTVNFSWIALAFTSAVLGFAVLCGRPRPAASARLATRTAVLMPVYNESTARTFAAVEAIRSSVEATGQGAAFDWFVLSDSTRPDAWVAEERAFLDLRRRLGPDARVHYRHRAKNHHRKAGNIADFVGRWGGSYDHMLVLDADSLMTGDCVVALAAAMQADPDAGIVQSLPLIINRNTLFARVQQFAARVYGPVIAAGLSAWSGRDGNYWGHNAIIRTRAFAAHCGLPDLPGKPPFGGHILSHDFVEAALIRRAGWSVYMLPTLAGSYEESPPSLTDVAVRDRRWAQGNLQHSRVIGSAGLALASRQHFATGIASYVASPLWLAQLVVGVAIAFQVAYGPRQYFPSGDFQLHPTWPRFDPVRALQLFGVTMGILLGPKFLGYILALIDPATRRGCGGGLRLTASAVVEVLLSALIAPTAMLVQSGSVAQILMGRDTGWNPQRRDDGSIPVRDIVRRHWWHTALGLVAGLSAFLVATSLFLWMSPTVIGLVLAVPISWASGSLALGLALRARGLLVTPEETDPPAIAAAANALEREASATGRDDDEALGALSADPRCCGRTRRCSRTRTRARGSTPTCSSPVPSWPRPDASRRRSPRSRRRRGWPRSATGNASPGSARSPSRGRTGRAWSPSGSVPSAAARPPGTSRGLAAGPGGRQGASVSAARRGTRRYPVFQESGASWADQRPGASHERPEVPRQGRGAVAGARGARRTRPAVNRRPGPRLPSLVHARPDGRGRRPVLLTERPRPGGTAPPRRARRKPAGPSRTPRARPPSASRRPGRRPRTRSGPREPSSRPAGGKRSYARNQASAASRPADSSAPLSGGAGSAAACGWPTGSTFGPLASPAPVSMPR